MRVHLSNQLYCSFLLSVAAFGFALLQILLTRHVQLVPVTLCSFWGPAVGAAVQQDAAVAVSNAADV